MKFNLRAMLVAFAFVAVAFYFFSLAFAERNDFQAFLPGATILATLIGAGLGGILRLRGRWRTALAIGFATAIGMACSFFVIQMEWQGSAHGDGTHPWPESHHYYVLLAVVRCGLLGGVIGYVVNALFAMAVGTSHADTISTDKTAEPKKSIQRDEAPPLRARRWLPLAVVIAALVATWWPYLSFHLEKRAVRRFMVAIDAGNVELARDRVAAVKRFHGERDALGGVSFMAGNGPNEKVRMAALQSLKLFDEPVFDAHWRDVLLDQIIREEPNAEIRAAAAAWKASSEQFNPAGEVGMRP